MGKYSVKDNLGRAPFKRWENRGRDPEKKIKNTNSQNDFLHSAFFGQKFKGHVLLLPFVIRGRPKKHPRNQDQRNRFRENETGVNIQAG